MEQQAQQPAAMEDEVAVTCSFFTRLPVEFRVPETPIAVPANLTRYGLSQIINHLLALDPARPFDFLVDGELLRLSLHKHLAAKQISTEAVLKVEYVPAVLPPTPKEQHPHEDWVSAIAGLGSGGSSSGGSGGSGTIASGAYDGVVRLWRDGQEAASWAAHQGPVTAAVAVTSAGGAGPLLLTAGQDCAARLWRGVGEAAAGGPAPEAVAQLKGHSDAVATAAVAPNGSLAATGGWDSRLLLWRCGDELVAAAEAGEEEEEGGEAGAQQHKGGKRRKVANGLAAAQHVEAPRGELQGHSQCVAGVAWPAAGTLASCSWDHSVRLWDVEAAAERETFHHNKAVYCVGAAPGGSGLVAFGGAERALRVWDPRLRSGEGLAVRACASHSGWISAVAWHPSSAHHVATASHDGTAKLWDLRASIPLHTLEPHGGEKVLCAAWVGPSLLATGGADCKLATAEVQVVAAQ